MCRWVPHWRDGSNTPLTSRFVRLRVRPARGDAKRSEPAAEEWLLIEWPEGAAAPDHYWLATLQADISLERMVDQARLRWRIERDYLELKQEGGRGHYEGCGWRGFHHHATLCIAAGGFLISEKETIPPRAGPHLARRAICPSPTWLCWTAERACVDDHSAGGLPGKEPLPLSAGTERHKVPSRRVSLGSVGGREVS